MDEPRGHAEQPVTEKTRTYDPLTWGSQRSGSRLFVQENENVVAMEGVMPSYQRVPQTPAAPGEETRLCGLMADWQQMPLVGLLSGFLRGDRTDLVNLNLNTGTSMR